jgi:hypothetical protein
MECHLQTGHHHPGGNTMTADVCHHEAVCTIHELQEVEIISAHDLGRTAECRNIKP